MTATMAAPARASLNRRHLIIGFAAFAAMLVLLVGAYMLFLRPEYRVLYTDLRQVDAAAIVGELDRQGVPYRLREGGSTILVPEDQRDAVRLALTGSEAAARGLVGFELFNESDMGLTNFAQKINYQRALQGELVRTIMMIDGVESARVHLAIPERALFKGDRSLPKAAVTIAMTGDRKLDEGRVAGVQRLVAAAVPDMPESQVVVLDRWGAVLSPSPADTALQSPNDAEGAAALYYRARIRSAVARVMPGLQHSVHVNAQPLSEERVHAGREFALAVRFLTPAPLNSEDQSVVRGAIEGSIGFDPAAGDSLAFELGLAETRPTPTGSFAPPTADLPQEIPAPSPATGEWDTGLWWLPAGVALLAMFAVLLRRRRRAALGSADHDAFADRLRARLQMDGGDAI